MPAAGKRTAERIVGGCRQQHRFQVRQTNTDLRSFPRKVLATAAAPPVEDQTLPRTALRSHPQQLLPRPESLPPRTQDPERHGQAQEHLPPGLREQGQKQHRPLQRPHHVPGQDLLALILTSGGQTAGGGAVREGEGAGGKTGGGIRVPLPETMIVHTTDCQ